MKIDVALIHEAEYRMIDGIEIWDAISGQQSKEMLAYISGIHDMAYAIIKLLQEVDNG